MSIKRGEWQRRDRQPSPMQCDGTTSWATSKGGDIRCQLENGHFCDHVRFEADRVWIWNEHSGYSALADPPFRYFDGQPVEPVASR